MLRSTIHQGCNEYSYCSKNEQYHSANCAICTDLGEQERLRDSNEAKAFDQLLPGQWVFARIPGIQSQGQETSWTYKDGCIPRVAPCL